MQDLIRKLSGNNTKQMQIHQLKEELNLSNKDLADIFRLGYKTYMNSSARERYERAICQIYELAKENNKVVTDCDWCGLKTKQ